MKCSVKKLMTTLLVIAVLLSSFVCVFATTVQTTSYNFDNLNVGDAVSEFALTKTANANLFAKVSNKFFYSGANSLWIYDNSNAAIAKTFTPITETKQLTLTFEIYPESFATNGCYAVSLTGDTAAAEGGAIVNHIYIFYDGSIKSYNGANVITILPAGTIKPNHWNKIKVTADIAGNCYVYANNSAVGTACFWKTASSYKSIYFSTYGGQELGDSFYLDYITVNNIFDNTPLNKTSCNFDSLNVGDAVNEFALTKTANENLFAKVSNKFSSSGANSLWIYDNSNAAIAKTFTPITETKHLTLTFEVYPETFAFEGCYAVSLTGDTAAVEGGAIVNNIYIFYDGSIKSYDGANVFTILPAGTVKPNQWNKIKITADIAGNCYVYANNSTAGTACFWKTASSYKSIYFSSYGGGEYGDSFYLDDIVLNEFIVSSDEYTIGDSIISNIALKTTVSDFLANLSVNPLYTKVEILDADGKNMNDTNYSGKCLYVGTGMTINIYDGGVFVTYNALIKGDITGEGEQNVLDLVAVRNHLLLKNTLSGLKERAADYNNNQTIELVDIMDLKAAFIANL